MTLWCGRLASAFSLGSKTLFHECEPPSAPDETEVDSSSEVVPAGFAEPSWSAQPETHSHQKPQKSPPKGPLLHWAAPVVCWQCPWRCPLPGRASPPLPRTPWVHPSCREGPMGLVGVGRVLPLPQNHKTTCEPWQRTLRPQGLQPPVLTGRWWVRRSWEWEWGRSVRR